MENKYVRTLKKLCETPGISGNESQTGISNAILEELRQFNRKSFEDQFGNIIAVFGSGKKKILLDAHIDEVGFMTSKNNGEEIPLLPIGEINPQKNKNARVFIFQRNIKGNIIVKNDNFFFKPNYPNSSKNVLAGELVIFERFFELKNDIITATALDNRIGCAVIIELMKEIKIPKDLTIITVFSTEEEKDCSTVGNVASKYKVDFGVIVDAAYAKPIEIDSDRTSIPELGKGCAIQHLGKNFIVSRSVTQKFEELAQKNNIKNQPEIPLPDTGRTNFPQLEKVGIRTGIINIPARNQHTPKSQMNLNDAIEAIKLLKAVIKNYKEFVN